MAGITVRTSLLGADVARRQFSKQRAELLLKAVEKAILRGAILIEGRARRRAPVAFGALRANITHSDLELHGTTVLSRVGTDKKYAKFVEFGTGPAGASSQLTASAQEFMAEHGYQYGARGGWVPFDAIVAWAKRKGIADAEMAAFAIQRHIRQEGTRAQPFLFNSFEESRKDVEEDIKAAVRQEVSRQL